MKLSSKLLKNIHLSKAEVILRSVPRHKAISVFADKYKNYLNTLPKISTLEEIRTHVSFPYSSFNSFPKDTLTKIINESFEIIKSKVETDRHTYLYNEIMSNYIINEINFDVKALLQEMNDCGVSFNRDTYKALIVIYTRCGEMELVESLIKSMRSKGIAFDLKDRMAIITGYVRTGQSVKLKAYLEENNLNENDEDILISVGRGYAVLGDCDKVVSIITKMKENNFDIVPCIYTFYRLLAISNAPEPDLEQISSLIPNDNIRSRITSVIWFSNRLGYYGKSLKFAKKYKGLLLDRNILFDLLTSFNSEHCPKNIYKSVLKLFSRHIKNSHDLFANMDYDEALEFSRTITNIENGKTILASLLNKSISDKSVDSIKKSLQFGVDNLRIRKLNLQLQYGFIPCILESGMVSNCRELLDLLPEFKNKLLSCVLMYHLCKGNFDEYHDLMSYRKPNFYLIYFTYFDYLALEVIENVGLGQIEKLASEASKMFNPTTVNALLSSVFMELFVEKLRNKDVDGLSEMVKLAQKLNVTFEKINIMELKKSNPEYSELLDELSIGNETVVEN